MGSSLTHQYDRVLGKAAVVAFTLLLVCAAVTTAAFFSPTVRSSLFPGFKPESGYLAGDVVDVPVKSHLQSRRTVILFARSSCSACQSSRDGIRQIVLAARARGADAMMFTPESGSEAEFAYAESAGFGRSSVRGTTHKLRVRLVPTILLVDDTGRILFAKEGKPSTEDQAKLAGFLN